MDCISLRDQDVFSINECLHFFIEKIIIYKSAIKYFDISFKIDCTVEYNALIISDITLLNKILLLI